METINQLDLSVNPITGFPNDHKQYRYPKADKIQLDTDADSTIDDKKVDEVLERLRYKGARKIRGYTFQGAIAEPKNATDYCPWLKGE